MRKAKWIAVAVLACCASLARGQCQPTNSPTLDFSNSTILTPSQYAAGGGVGTTLTVTATDSNGNPISGAKPSHRLTAGNTWLTFNYDFWNVASWSSYYTVNSDPTHYATGFTGNSHQWFLSNGDNGDVWKVYVTATNANGNTTQDMVVVTAGTGTQPTIISQDAIPSNGILVVNLTYSGTPNIPYQTTCPNAAEKDMVPTAQLQLANATSGENRVGVSLAGATTVVGQPVYAAVSDGISFIPGDVIVPSSGGFVYCSAIGDFWQLLDTVSVEWAWTKAQTIPSTCHNVPGGGVRCNLTPFCSGRSSPPDWIPHEITTNQFGIGNIPSFWLGGSIGFSIANSPYIFPGSIIAGILPGAVNWATFLAPGIPSTSTVIDCTNTPNNIHPIIPWPF